MSEYFLLFTQHFDRDKGLDWGRLSINSLSLGTTYIWKATSSHSTKQYAESFHVNSFFIGRNVRHTLKAGNGSYTPFCCNAI